MRILRILSIVCWIQIIYVDSLRPDFHRMLFDLTHEIVSGYFDKFRCVTYITDEREDEHNFTEDRPVLLVRLSRDASEEERERKILMESYEQSCGGYVIRVDNAHRALTVKRLISAKRKTIGGRYNSQRYLFLPKNEQDVNSDLLEDPQMFFMPNLVIIAPEGNNSFALSTHTLLDHHKHDVRGITREVLDVWSLSRGFESGADLYPDKVKNAYGRKFVFACLNYSPFSIVFEEGNKTMFDGFETRVTAMFLETINGTWEGLDHPVELWGDIYPNGTSSGIAGSVYEHRADVGYSAIYHWFCSDTDCSYPFYQSGVTCLVPLPQLVSGWLTIILPLANNTWVMLISFYFINTLFVLIILLSLLHFKGLSLLGNIKMAVSDAFFTVFRLQLEQIPRIRKSKEPLAVYVGISVYYYFFVAAFWQGGIASILTVPRYEPPINSVPDLLHKWPKVKWGANSAAWVNSVKLSSDPNLIQIVSKFTVLSDEVLLGKAKTRNFAFFMEKLQHGHYGINDYVTEQGMKYLRIMENNIYTAFGVLILPRGSPYLEKLDGTLMWMYDTGLIHKLEDQVSLERVNNRLQNMIRYSNEKEQESVILGIRHIEGPLYIYIVGMSSALIAFLFERFVFRQCEVSKLGSHSRLFEPSPNFHR